MNSVRNLVLITASFVLLAACTKAVAPDTAADQAAIRAAQNAWYKAFNSGDAAAVTALYTDDAVVMAPGVPADKGNAAIREHLAKMVEEFRTAGLTANEGPTNDVGVSGDLAWQEASYIVTDKAGATVEAGKTLTVFQRKDGKWMMVRDTWNSDSPPPAQTASTTPPK